MMRKATKVIATIGVAGALLFGVTACDDDNQLDDAPLGRIDDTPSFVRTNVNEFPNVSSWCQGPNGKGSNGIYTTTRDGNGAIKIVVNDPECPGYDPEVPTVVSG